MPHFLDYNRCSFLVNNLVDGRHGAKIHHNLDNFPGLHRHLLCQFSNSDGFRYGNIMHDRRYWFFKCLGTVGSNGCSTWTFLLATTISVRTRSDV